MKLFKIAWSLLLLIAATSFGYSASEAATGVYPVVDLGAGCLLGAGAKGKWLDSDAVSPTLKGGESYRLYTLRGYIGQGTGSTASSVGAPCEETEEVAIGPLPKIREGVIAVGGQLRAMPRVPRAESNNQPVYIRATADILKRNGITNPKVKIIQVLRIDLEGDGVQEVIVSATNYAGSVEGIITPGAQAGDYSLVFLRKVVKGKLETVILDAEIYPGPKEFSAPAEYKVAGILDLNGDRVMEVVIHGNYYEGGWSTVYTINGTKVQEVLSCGCGA
ncbi:MAG: hypothetical protein ABIO92_06355 [Chloroflexia bacterium]